MTARERNEEERRIYGRVLGFGERLGLSLVGEDDRLRRARFYQMGRRREPFFGGDEFDKGDYEFGMAEEIGHEAALKLMWARDIAVEKMKAATMTEYEERVVAEMDKMLRG